MNHNNNLPKKMPKYLWPLLIVMLFIIIYLLIQNNRLSHREEVSDQASVVKNKTVKNPSSKSIPNQAKKPNIRQTLKNRKQSVSEMSPEQTGLRMFEELKTVTGNDQELLNELTQKLIEEAATQKELESALAQGDYTTIEFWEEVEQMRMETDEFAESLLEPLQYDRFREVRQSWAKGRIHPDRDSRE